jgi:hypothetical protein
MTDLEALAGRCDHRPHTVYSVGEAITLRNCRDTRWSWKMIAALRAMKEKDGG